MKVLIVEDEKDIADIQRFTLVERGHQVTTITENFEQLLSGDWSHIDVLVCDYRLGEKYSGGNILKFFKETYPKVRRVLVSATFLSDTGLEDVIDLYLGKPYSFIDLAVAVEGMGFTEKDGGGSALRNAMHRDSWRRLVTSIAQIN